MVLVAVSLVFQAEVMPRPGREEVDAGAEVGERRAGVGAGGGADGDRLGARAGE